MLAMTTTPSESSHQNVSLLRQQRELEKEKRAAEKSRMMPNHFDSLPLFNPPVKKEYNDETAARLKSLLGEPPREASRHINRSQDRRAAPPSVQHVREMDRRADSPSTHPRSADSSNVQCPARPAASQSGTLSEGKVIPPNVVSASGTVSSPRGQIANSAMPVQATLPFNSNSDGTKVNSPAGFYSGNAHRLTGHASIPSGGSAVQHDSHSSPRNSVFQKPLPKAPVNGPNGMKPILPRLVISDESVDHDVDSILKEMTPCLKPISGINTPRKEAPPLRFPVSSGFKEPVQQPEASEEDPYKSSGKTTDIKTNVADDLITSDTDESEKSDSEESHSSSSDSDDTSQSHDSDTDDDGSINAGSDMKSVKRNRSSQPTEVNTSFNSAVHGIQSTASGDSWSLEALEHSSRSKVETPPLEPLGLAGLPSRNKLLSSDRPGSWSKVLEEYSTPSLVHRLSPLPSTNERLTESNPSVPFDAQESTANASYILDDIIADGSENYEEHNDVKGQSPVQHLPQSTSPVGRFSPEAHVLPVSGDNDSDSDGMIDIESVSPAAHDVSARTGNDEIIEKILPSDAADSDCIAETKVVSMPGPCTVAEEEENSRHSEPKGADIAAEVHGDVTITNTQNVRSDSPPAALLNHVESPAGSRRTPVQTPKDDQPSLTAPVSDRLDTVGKQSLIVRIPLHVIGRLPKSDSCHASPKSVRNSTDKARRSRYTSTSLSSTASTDDDASAAEHDGIVQPLSSLAKSDEGRLKGSLTESGTNEVAQHKHSSKRKSTDQDDTVAPKKSKASKETLEKAPELSKVSASTKETRKGQKRTATPAQPMSQSDQNDAGSATKKRRSSSLAPSGDAEIDKANGRSKPDNSNGHGQQSSSVTPAPVLAPPTVPSKAAGSGCTNGLPFRTSLFSYDIDNAPEYQRGSDVYLSKARQAKHEADHCNDVMQKHLTYLDCILTFLLCARAIERESPTNISRIIKMYFDTYQLLSYYHKRKPSKSTDFGGDTCKNRQYGIWTILSLWTQSLLCQKLYKLNRHDTEKYHRTVDQFFKEPVNHLMASSATPLGHKNHGSPTSPAPSPAGSVASTSSMASDGGSGATGKRGVTCTPPRQPAGSALSTASSQAGTGISVPPNIVPLPHKTYAVVRSYTHNVRLLELCHHYWDQADLLVLEESHRAFFMQVEECVPPLTLHSSIIHLVHYLKLAVVNLRKMPESTTSGGRYS